MHEETSANEFLHRLGRELATQDNRATNQPMFVVYQERPEGTTRFVTVCFTQKAADEYINDHGHNLHNPWVYIDSGFDNWEWCIIGALALDTYQRLNGQDKGD